MNENSLPISLVIMVVLMGIISFIPLLSPPISLMIVLLSLYVVILLTFCLVHGFLTLGVRPIIVFFIISSSITYVMEWLGTHYGLPFGSYYYTYKIGPLLFGVPLVIPIQWFNMLYVCYIMTKAVFTRFSPANYEIKNNTTVTHSIFVAMVTGAFMVAWDLINDPFMVGLGAWVWTNPLWFFGLTFQGIPITNFIGWEFTSFLAILIFEIYRQRYQLDIRWQSGKSKMINPLVLFPYILAYFSQAIQGIMFGIFPLTDTIGLTPLIIGGITMGLAILLSAIGLTRINGEQ